MSSLTSKLFLFFTLIIIAFNANAYTPESLLIQYAGDIGKYSIGASKNINNYYSISLHYGYVPSTAIQDKIETYTLKNNFNLARYNYQNFMYKLYTGLSLYHTPGNKYKTNEIAGAPNEYYRQSSIRGQIYIGHEFELYSTNAFYVESGINDIWLINSANNESVDYKDHLSLGIGYKYTF